MNEEKMKMLDTSKTISYNLRRLRLERKLTLEELSDEIEKEFGVKIHKGVLSRWENGSQPNLNSIKILALFYNVPVDDILGFEISPNAKKIPVLRNRDLDKEEKNNANIIGYGSLPPLTYYRDSVLEQLFYLTVTDSFMDRVYPVGSIVLIRRNAPYNVGDHILVKLENEDQAIIAKYEKQDNFIFLIPISTKPKHTPIIIDIDNSVVKVIGKVIACTILND